MELLLTLLIEGKYFDRWCGTCIHFTFVAKMRKHKSSTAYTLTDDYHTVTLPIVVSM